MEMLIVVAIIADTDVAIAIPVFSAKLENVRETGAIWPTPKISRTALKAYYLTSAGDGQSDQQKTKIFGRNVGYVYVNEDGARCARGTPIWR
jgi:competence protein ComGC